MSAPIGNRFWEQRSKHGRDTLFASPELMWEAACEYFKWCEDNDLKEVDFRGKDADEVELPKARVFTMQGLCRHLDCNTDYFRQFKHNLKSDQQGFSWVITRIEETIYEQKFTLAAAGFLNANIISRDLGLVDKTDNNHKVKLGVAADDVYE